jgi:hypothetical protein
MMTTNNAGRHKVLGPGGVFVRARDPEALAAWYREHLSMACSRSCGRAMSPSK